MPPATIIPAQPTDEHAKHFAQLAQIASDSVFTELLGNRAESTLRAMFLRADNENSHAHCAFLIQDENIAGMVQAYSTATAKANSSRSNILMLRYAGLQIFRFLAIAILMRDILDFIAANLAPDDFYISMLAIYSHYRGQGHSKSLLSLAQEQAIAADCSRLTLDVDERNHIAIKAYHRAGFHQIDASKKITENGQPWGLLRMAKTL